MIEIDGKPFIAHISGDMTREQTLAEHLNGVSNRAKDFAAAFGAGDIAGAIGLCHDVGKYSEEFQRRIRGENIRVDHSTAGGQLLSRMSNGKLGLLAAYCIMGHHSGLPNGGSESDRADESTLYARLKRTVEDYSRYSDEISVPALLSPDMRFNDAYGLAFITRMLFSSLVDADWLDTEEFFREGSTVLRGAEESIDELYLKMLVKLDRFLEPEGYVSELNKRRTELLRNCIDAASLGRGLFTLTAPTGSGKTIASMAFALTHAKKHGMRRIIYVVPYNTIIEQNAEVFEEYISAENVLQHHSNINYDSSEDERDYERKRNSTENWEYPFIITSSVQFFESLFSAKPSKCRKLHNIAGSVVVFDESQMIPRQYLWPCIRAIRELVENYGCTAVLATATQSALERFFEPMKLREITDNPSELYEFLRRTRLSLLESPLSDSELSNQLNLHNQALCIVNKRKTAQTLFSFLNQEGCFHLSTAMYPKHRSRVLKEIRERLDTGRPCRVVSTSLVEAGVDLDFPVVYRELAGLDSIMQATGRCNREGEPGQEKVPVYVFELTDCEPPKSISTNISVLRQIARRFDDLSSPEAVHAYFEQLFYNVGDESLDKKGVLKALTDRIGSFSFPYSDIADSVKLIEDDTKSIYVLFEAPELEKRLRYGERSRELFREAAQYSVSLYTSEVQSLVDLGAAVYLDSELVLLTEGYYKDYGVELVPEGGMALIC